MRPGEVWQVDYPLSEGREQAGPRPAVVLQDDGFALRSPLALTIPFSTSAGTMRYPAVIPVDSTPANGMPHDSFLLVFQLRATDRRRVRRRLGIIPPEVLSAVYQALDRLTGRPHTTGQP